MRSTVSAVLLLLLAVAGAPAAEKLDVAVSIPPQAYFVERIGGDRVEIQTIVGTGQSPHTYQATPKQMILLSGADVYFRIGTDFERAFVPRVKRMFGDLRIVDLRQNVPMRRLEHQCDHASCSHDHQHDHGTHQQHQESQEAADQPPAATIDKDDRLLDPHTWLSPRLVKIQARTICDTLAEIDPAHAETYRKNLAAFHKDLDKSHDEIATALAPLEGEKVYVFHPAFGYFLDEFGLKQVPVEIEGKEPSAKRIVELIAQAKADNVHVIFVQPQFSKKAAAAIARAIDGAVVPMDPLARDYLNNLRDMTEKLKAGLTRK